MKYVRNVVVVMLLCILMVNMMPVNSLAINSDRGEIKTDAISYSPGGYDIQKTEIITKYRICAGKLQYRRWNVTRGKWVDPYWINA